VQLPLPVGPAVGARAVGVEPGGDAELSQPLDERQVLRIDGPLDLLCLPVGCRPVERARFPVADRDEQADLTQPGRKVIGVVPGPALALPLGITPEG
jgi:hypothetical protein